MTTIAADHNHVAYRRARIEEARTHQAGWFDGDGDPITDAALAAAETISTDLEAHAPGEHWYVTGTEEGGMLFEATRTPEESDTSLFHCTTVEVEPNGTEVHVHCLAVVAGGGRHKSDHIETDVVGAIAKTLELRRVVIETLATTISNQTTSDRESS